MFSQSEILEEFVESATPPNGRANGWRAFGSELHVHGNTLRMHMSMSHDPDLRLKCFEALNKLEVTTAHALCAAVGLPSTHGNRISVGIHLKALGWHLRGHRRCEDRQRHIWSKNASQALEQALEQTGLERCLEVLAWLEVGGWTRTQIADAFGVDTTYVSRVAHSQQTAGQRHAEVRARLEGGGRSRADIAEELDLSLAYVNRAANGWNKRGQDSARIIAKKPRPSREREGSTAEKIRASIARGLDNAQTAVTCDTHIAYVRKIRAGYRPVSLRPSAK